MQALARRQELHREEQKPWNRIIRALSQSCAYCVGAGASGLLASHAGCLVAPLITTLASGSAAMAGHDPLVMTATGAGINLATLGTWYLVRGRHVSRPIRTATFTIAAIGFAAATGYNWSARSLESELMRSLCISDPARPAPPVAISAAAPVAPR